MPAGQTTAAFEVAMVMHASVAIKACNDTDMRTLFMAFSDRYLIALQAYNQASTQRDVGLA